MRFFFNKSYLNLHFCFYWVGLDGWQKGYYWTTDLAYEKSWTMPSIMRIIPNLCACFLLPNVSKTCANFGKMDQVPKCLKDKTWLKKSNCIEPSYLAGDSSRDLLIPDRWRSLTTFEKVTFLASQNLDLIKIRCLEKTHIPKMVVKWWSTMVERNTFNTEKKKRTHRISSSQNYHSLNPSNSLEDVKVLRQKGCPPEFNTMQDPKGSMGRVYLYLYILYIYYKKTKIHVGKSMDI